MFLFHDFFKEVKRRFTGVREEAPSPDADAYGGGSDDDDDQTSRTKTQSAPSGKSIMTSSNGVSRTTSQGKPLFNTTASPTNKQ